MTWMTLSDMDKNEYFPDSMEAVAQRRFVTAVLQGYKPCESKESREVGNTQQSLMYAIALKPV
jgi:hypothetical protein